MKRIIHIDISTL